jgi:hypothetical protein
MNFILQKFLFVTILLLANKICFAQYMYFTHDTGTLQFAAFNNGTIGSNVGTGGVYFQGGNNLNAMYKGGIIIGTSSNGVNGITDWFDDMSSSLAIADYSTNLNFNQVANASFKDNLAPVPFNFDFYQQTFSNTNDDFVLYSYTIVNNSDMDVNDLYVGIFADWDVGFSYGSSSNLGGYDQSRDLAYQYEFGGYHDPNFYGIVALSGMTGARVTTELSDSIRSQAFEWMTTFLNEQINIPGDYRTYIGCGPYSIPSGSSVNIGFAFVAGSDLTDLRVNSDIAQYKWNSGIVTMPFVYHDGPKHYHGTIGDNTVEANIFDYSGISSANLHYTVDGGGTFTLNPSSINGQIYKFIIPAQVPGAMIDYWFEVAGNSGNSITSNTSSYIAGNFSGDPFVPMFYYVYNGQSSTGIAVKHTIPEGYICDLVKAVFLIYNRPDIGRTDSVRIHIWSDENGFPGNDLIPSFKVKNNEEWGKDIIVDFRSYLQLSGFSGSFHLGITLEPEDTIGMEGYGPPAMYYHTSINSGSGWIQNEKDHYFYAILGDFYANTTLSANATAGSQILEVASINGFSIGDNILINPGGANEETNQITGFGSMLIQTPLIYDHQAGELVVNLNPTSVDKEPEIIPQDYVLYNNYPNPFNPTTKIMYSIPQKSQVVIKMFDILGSEIETLVNEEKPAGTYEITWYAADLPSGVYFYQLRAGAFIETRKMVLLR